jgi:pSer/pThr/pTyr-binding forkhead associated (FHA) protein
LGAARRLSGDSIRKLARWMWTWGRSLKRFYISRHHAEIWCGQTGQWFIKDLGSGNATFVCAAGERQFRKTAGEHAIKDGDEIALGNARFEFRVS